MGVLPEHRFVLLRGDVRTRRLRRGAVPLPGRDVHDHAAVVLKCFEGFRAARVRSAFLCVELFSRAA